MTTHKFIKHEGYSQSSDTATVNSLKDPIALAIWTYLQHRPSSWIPREKQIREHFSLGHDRYRNAIAVLKGCGLVEKEVIRGESGRITGNIFHLVFGAPSQRASENEST